MKTPGARNGVLAALVMALALGLGLSVQAAEGDLGGDLYEVLAAGERSAVVKRAAVEQAAAEQKAKEKVKVKQAVGKKTAEKKKPSKVKQTAGEVWVEAGDVAPLLLPPAISVAQAPEALARPEPNPPAPPRDKTPAAPSPSGAASLLGRSLVGVTIDAAPAADVAEQSEMIKEENQIRDLAAAQFDAGARLVTPSMRAPGGLATGFAWAAPALYHRPLLFEQPNVERYGHQAVLWPGDRDTQSVVSGAHFFGSVAALPYLIGAYGCCEPEYVLGSYRPGSCNPHRVVKPRLSRRGLAAQAAVTTGLVFFVP